MIRSCPVARKRARLLCLLIAGLVLVEARLVWLQVARHGYYDGLAARQHSVTFRWTEARGDVMDRRGRMLAQSMHCRSLWADPSLVDRDQSFSFAGKAAGILGMNPDDLLRLLTSPGKRFVWLKRRLSPDEERAITPLVFSARGVDFREEWERFYPTGPMLSPVLGVVGTDQYGLSGMELCYERVLRGQSGERIIFCDARQQQVSSEPVFVKQAREGSSLVLTVDRAMETFLYCALEKGCGEYKPKSASGLVMDAHTGEILALATVPSQDPSAGIDRDMQGLVPRMIVDVYEPGSTMKPFIYATLLEHGLGRPEDKLHCGNGEKSFGGRVIHDVHPYGLLSLEDVIVKSSNIGAAQMGLRLGNRRIHDSLRNLGFGQKSYLPLPGESAGMLRPLSKWTSFSTISVPIGHEISVSMIQVAVAYGALANGGYVMQPNLVKEIRTPRGRTEKENRPVSFRRVFSENTCRLTARALEKVVEKGTARKARSELYTIAGKTGTTEKLVDGKYVKNRNVASFAGFAPAGSPEIVVVIVFDEPSGASFGGVVAAPVATRVIEDSLRYLGIAPDRRPSEADPAGKKAGKVELAVND